MDFKSLISKLDSMDAPPKTPAAPTIDRAVQLNEDAQLRVLAGQTTYVSEAKKKKDEEVKEEMKTGDKKPSSTGGTIEKTATGVKHHAGKNYGGSKAEADSDDEDDKPKKKAKKESVEPEFKSKFMKMVEAKKEEAADKKKKMEEAKKPDDDGDGVPDWADKKPGEDDNADKPAGKKGMSDKQAKYFGKKDVKEGSRASTGSAHDKLIGSISSRMKDTPQPERAPKDQEEADSRARMKRDQAAIANSGKKKDESKMMPTGKKKTVKESVETKMSFKEMVQLVQESGGQQQIDPVDKALFTWAERVAKNKLGEGMKADLYAGLVYERNGGVFEMYDVLSESKKKVVESRSQLDEGIMDMLAPYVKKAANALMSKFDPKTLQGLKQAHDQSGGDRNKFMAAIGITKQDLAPLAKDLQPMKEGGRDDSFAKVAFGTGTSLKSKVLTGVFNIVPTLGMTDLLTGGAIGNALTAATGGSALQIIFYLVSAALIWGVGSYNFSDMDDGAPQLPGDTGS